MAALEEPETTTIFKSVGTDVSNSHHFPKRKSPSLPIQCWMIFEHFVLAYNSGWTEKSTLIWAGRGQTFNCTSLKRAHGYPKITASKLLLKMIVVPKPRIV